MSTACEAIAAAGRSNNGFTKRKIGFSGPVAALWGEHDALVAPAHAEALQRALPQAHIEVWDRMGHHPQRERPRSLARYIERHASLGHEQASASQRHLRAA